MEVEVRELMARVGDPVAISGPLEMREDALELPARSTPISEVDVKPGGVVLALRSVVRDVRQLGDPHCVPQASEPRAAGVQRRCRREQELGSAVALELAAVVLIM